MGWETRAVEIGTSRENAKRLLDSRGGVFPTLDILSNSAMLVDYIVDCSLLDDSPECITVRPKRHF